MAHEIDQEVRKIIESCHKQATEVISENRDLLDNIAKYLLLVETLNYNDIQEIKETGGLKHYDDEQKALELSAQEPANVEESVETKVEDAKNEETTEDKKD